MHLKEFKQQFDIHFFSFVDKKILEYTTLLLDDQTKSLFDHVKKYLSGGKRLRPYGAYLAMIEQDHILQKKDWMLLVSLELIHVLALVHDDIIDRSVDRRGVQSLHTYIYSLRTVTRGDAVHFANAQAMLVGDIIFAAAFQAILESEAPYNVQKKIHQMLDEVILGQMLDVRLSYTDFVSLDIIMQKSRYKTALYTFSRPFEIGSLLVDAPLVLQNEFVAIGESLGMLYQLQDDILDVFDTKGELKKTLMNDIQEGQQTFVTHYFLEHASFLQKEEFLKYFGKSISKEDTVRLMDLFEEVGLRDIVMQELHVSFQNVTALINQSSIQQGVKQILLDLVGVLGQRT